MRMPGFCNRSLGRCLRDRRGAATVELAFALPMLLVLSAGMVEVGRALFQANALEKALRAGALYAAHQPMPLSDTARTAAENVIRTGRPDGTAPAILGGMDSETASISVTTHDYDLGGEPVPVVRATAAVPFDPLIPGVEAILGDGGYVFTMRHDQGYIGN